MDKNMSIYIGGNASGNQFKVANIAHYLIISVTAVKRPLHRI